MLIDRLQVTLAGGQVGSGVSTHFGIQGSGQLTTWQVFWEDLTKFMPLGMTVHVPNTGDRIEVESGLLQSVWTAATSATTYVGIDQGPYAAGVGACVTWLTAGIVNGHRVRGRTFIVPLDGTRYQNDGTLAPGTVAAITNAAQNVLDNAAGNSVIYSRKVPGRDGTAHAITGFRINDRVATLASRR